MGELRSRYLAYGGWILVGVAAGAAGFVVLGRQASGPQDADVRNCLKQVGVYFTVYESRYGSQPRELVLTSVPSHLSVCPACARRWDDPGTARETEHVPSPDRPLNPGEWVLVHPCSALSGRRFRLWSNGRVESE
jgi:hypothetical protein